MTALLAIGTLGGVLFFAFAVLLALRLIYGPRV